MGNAQDAAGVTGAQVLKWLGTIFSPLLLAAVGVIVSGKLIAARFPVNIAGDDKFAINIGMLKLRATGPAVPLGFGLFILSLGITVICGGRSWYVYFRDRAGIDIGHWDSLVAIASFLCIITSLVIFVSAPFFRRGAPVVSEAERNAQIRALDGNRKS